MHPLIVKIHKEDHIHRPLALQEDSFETHLPARSRFGEGREITKEDVFLENREMPILQKTLGLRPNVLWIEQTLFVCRYLPLPSTGSGRSDECGELAKPQAQGERIKPIMVSLSNHAPSVSLW